MYERVVFLGRIIGSIARLFNICKSNTGRLTDKDAVAWQNHLEGKTQSVSAANHLTIIAAYILEHACDQKQSNLSRINQESQDRCFCRSSFHPCHCLMSHDSALRIPSRVKYAVSLSPIIIPDHQSHSMWQEEMTNKSLIELTTPHSWTPVSALPIIAYTSPQPSA